MEIIKIIKGLVAPLDRANVDTDAIMPKHFLKSIKRTGFGPFIFDEWRYLDHGEPGMDCTNRPLNLDFSLNKPQFHGAQILLTRDNFGCGSSREHAPWGLSQYGFKVIIAPSFGEIFYSNCMKNSLLPVVLDTSEVDYLFEEVNSTIGYSITVDLPNQVVSTTNGKEFKFNIDTSNKNRLLEGLDDIAVTLQYKDKILAYEQKRKSWLLQGIKDSEK